MLPPYLFTPFWSKHERCYRTSKSGAFFVLYLKGPMHDIFGSGVFTLITPVWVGDLESSRKISKNLGFCLKFAIL
jgi:hypothetical protein